MVVMAAKRRVLIVDDNKMALRLTSHLFQKANYEIHTATNGSGALVKALDIKPDLIILDVMMPDMSGLQVCQRLRTNPSTTMLPIIIMSARGRIDDKLSGFQAGADDYVQKPVDPKELLARAGALMERSSRTRPRRGRIIGVIGAKGGVGVTTVAVNMAMALTQEKKSVILTELRSYRGTVTQNLNLTVSQDLSELLAMDPAKIGPQDVTRRLKRHSSGVRTLIAPQQVTPHTFTADHTKTIIDILSAETEYLILDLPPVSGESMKQALDQTNQILLITEPEPISLACTGAHLETLRVWNALDRVSLVVVSRAQSSTVITPQKVGQELGLPVVGVLPPAPEVFYLAASVGKPVVLSRPDTLAAKNLITLTQKLTEPALMAG